MSHVVRERRFAAIDRLSASSSIPVVKIEEEADIYGQAKWAISTRGSKAEIGTIQAVLGDFGENVVSLVSITVR